MSRNSKRAVPDDGLSNSPDRKRRAGPLTAIPHLNTNYTHNIPTGPPSLPQDTRGVAGPLQNTTRVNVLNEVERPPPTRSRRRATTNTRGTRTRNDERLPASNHETLNPGLPTAPPQQEPINQQLHNHPHPTQPNDRRGTATQIAVNNITAGNGNNDHPNLPVPEGLNNLLRGRNHIRHIAEYFEDITETLYNTQGVLEDYMAKQPTISQSMRAILINWIAEVIVEFNLTAETNYLAIIIMDRYLQDNEIQRDQLQLLGITCLLIASKVEDVNTPTVKDFADISDNTYTAVQILQMERIVLDKLCYQFCIPTEGSFIPIYIQLVIEHLDIDPSSQIYMDFVELTNFICEMSKLCYPTMTFLASIVAASSTYIALHAVQRRCTNITFDEGIVTLFRINEHNRGTFRHCVNTIQNYVTNYPDNLRAIPDKYQRVVNFDIPMGNLFPPNART